MINTLEYNENLEFKINHGETEKKPLGILFYWERTLQDCLNMYLKVLTEGALFFFNDLSN